MHNTFHTPVTRQANKQTEEDHAREIEAVLDEVNGILEYKGKDYDNLRTFVERMVFGDFSWASLIYIKADRLCSTLMMDGDVEAKTDDCLIDLIVYSVAYRAWRNIQKRAAEAVPVDAAGRPLRTFQYQNGPSTLSAGAQAAQSLINKGEITYIDTPTTNLKTRKED